MRFRTPGGKRRDRITGVKILQRIIPPLIEMTESRKIAAAEIAVVKRERRRKAMREIPFIPGYCRIDKDEL